MLSQGPANRARAEGMHSIHVTARSGRADGVGQTSVPFGEQAVGPVGQRPFMMTR